MEFVSSVKDMLNVCGEVRPLDNHRGIWMSLPEQQFHDSSIHRIVYGMTKSGKKYIETISNKNGNWPVYGEASIPEILVFARKAIKEMPDSQYAKELYVLGLRIEVALNQS